MSDEPTSPVPAPTPPTPAPPPAERGHAKAVVKVVAWAIPIAISLGLIQQCSNPPLVNVVGNVYAHDLPPTIGTSIEGLVKLARNVEEPPLGCHEFVIDAKRGERECVPFKAKENRSTRLSELNETLIKPRGYRSQGKVVITNGSEKEIVNVRFSIPYDGGEFTADLPGEKKQGLFSNVIQLGNLSPGDTATIVWWGFNDDRDALRRQARVTFSEGWRPIDVPTHTTGFIASFYRAGDWSFGFYYLATMVFVFLVASSLYSVISLYRWLRAGIKLHGWPWT